VVLLKAFPELAEMKLIPAHKMNINISFFNAIPGSPFLDLTSEHSYNFADPSSLGLAKTSRKEKRSWQIK
jgi:hypothetical protein